MNHDDENYGNDTPAGNVTYLPTQNDDLEEVFAQLTARRTLRKARLAIVRHFLDAMDTTTPAAQEFKIAVEALLFPPTPIFEDDEV